MQKRFLRQKRSLAVSMAVCLLLCQIFYNVQLTVSAAEYTEPSAAVKEIDLGDYQSQMAVGEKQLLVITVLPEEASGQDIAYSSSNPQVAAVNGMGRISALSAGTTDITVSCGGISEKFALTVVNAENTAVRDIDLGDCPKEIEAGSSQLLSVVVIPEEASSQGITYQSSDTKIATINEIGRVTGVAAGSVTITVCCGGIKKEFSLKVTEAKSDGIPVREIEIAEHEDELEVDKTLTLSVTVLPSDATDSTVTYKSSNEKIATVNSSGEVKGISKGEATITVSAGKVTKKVKLKVKTATSKIELNTTYLIMQLGESYMLKVSVFPAEADQAVTFESLNPEIVSVTSAGGVTAKSCGTGTVLVKNSDTSTAVTIIVNEGGEAVVSDGEEEKQAPEETKYASVVASEDYPVISSDMLRFFYENNEVLTIDGNGYILMIAGKQIRNFDNELYTELELKEEAQGMGFELNRSKKLCGMVTVQFDNDILDGRYVYLYNEARGKYELLKTTDGQGLELDTGGKYLLTEQKLPEGRIKIVAVIIAGSIFVALVAVYIVVKKRYWFW